MLDPDGVVAARERGGVRHPRASSAQRGARASASSDLGTEPPALPPPARGGARVPRASRARARAASSWRSSCAGATTTTCCGRRRSAPRDGTHAGFILVLQDVTYLRDQEARREQLMATLSHELRHAAHVAAHGGRAARARLAPPLDAERAKLVETAHEDVARLEDVAQRLLDVSRSRAMSIALERQHVDLGDVIARVRAHLRAPGARAAASRSRRRSPETDLRIAGDQTKLTWALSNLIANALRYTPRGGRVTIGAERRRTASSGVACPTRAPASRPSSASASSSASCRGRTAASRAPPGLGLADRARHRAGPRRAHLPRQRGRPGEPLHARAAAAVD